MEIKQTRDYARWFRRLKDTQGKARINIALRRCLLAGKVVGDVKPVGDKIMEMRIHTGPGYRIYFTSRANTLILLLIGGDKSTQPSDIAKAKAIAAKLTREEKCN